VLLLSALPDIGMTCLPPVSLRPYGVFRVATYSFIERIKNRLLLCRS
jgi:hypothetical protein